MTVSAIQPSAVDEAAPSLVTRARALLTSEWTKFWSVRSTYWTLLVMVVTPIAIGDFVSFTLDKVGRGNAPPLDPLLPGVLSLEYAVLAVCVLGVLQFSAEYSTGLIRTTFTAVPHRRAVLAAKAIITGIVAFTAGEVVAFSLFFLDQAVLNSNHHGVSWSHPGAPGKVVASGTLLFVCAMIALGLGAILRHTAGGIAATIAVIVLPSILAVLPEPWGPRISRFTLVSAGEQVSLLHPSTHLFSPAWSLVVLFAWPAIALIIAAVLIKRPAT
jgi:ABC-2 type transport system permease protein